ncbi:MAG: PAS domain S-box protein [Chloroflexota bacterium]|nr:PAS domain S-box protein [Chloroflexota bacterium]
MDRIQGYTVKSEVSRSFCSVLYRGTRDDDDKPVLIRTCGTADATPAQIARFRREFSALHALKPDGVITALSIESHSDGLALILEDFKGIPLKEYFEADGYDTASFLDIADQLARTLDQIHRANLTHEGLKPQNIWINSETGQIKLIDFGLSVLTRENEQIYDPDVLRETLPYVSPEQTGRMNRTVDYRTDFYSLGVVLYELLTGAPPFSSNNPLELFHSHIAKMPKPPAKVNSDIPEAISDIVVKMLSKNPEDRYQSGYGLEADLEACLEQLNRTGKIEPFPLGRDDVPDKLVVSQQIYGREKEIGALMEAFEHVGRGDSELMLVAGFAGVGKTVLVNEIHKPIVERQGYFISGKFERLHRDMPYNAIVQAFARLIRQVLSESEERVSSWKGQLREALGDNGKIITDVIPEVELLIEKQPDVPELGPEETQKRFNLVFQSFVRAFPRRERPMVIFLDDLQWADPASLGLLKTLITDPSIRYILFIGAFRDNEVTGAHPLALWMDEIKKTGVVFDQITLQPLGLTSVNQLIADTLKCVSTLSKPLAELVLEKTLGNPFFAKQMLEMLYDDEMLTFSAGSGWQWDMGQIGQIEVTDDVVDLMAARILTLPEDNREVIRLAAVIGNRFDLKTLAEILGKPIDQTYADLHESVDHGLVLPTDIGYRFFHDRVQEAAYSLVPEQNKRQLHHRIGRLLLQSANLKEASDKIFGIVNHLNLGVELVAGQAERNELAWLNLTAGARARALTAYEAANHYLEIGIDLLPADAWKSEYDLTLSLYAEMSEVKYLTGDQEQAERFFDEVLRNAERLLDKIRVYEVKITSYTVLNKRKEALNLGIDALLMLGLDMPREANPQVIQQEMIAVRENIGARDVESLVDLPEISDPRKLAAARILMSCSVAAYTSAPEYLPVIVLKLVNLSLECGNSVYAPFAYVTYGLILCGRLGEIELGYRFGKLALEVVDKLGAKGVRAKVYYVFGDMINHWKKHYREDIEYLLEAYKSGSETGDIAFASYAVNHYAITSFLIGEPLTKVREKLDRYHQVIKQYGQLSVVQEYELWYQMVINLGGETEDRLLIKGEISDENELVPEWERTNMLTAIGYYTVAKQLVLYLYGAFERSIETARAGARCIDTMTGMNLVAEYHFYYSLSLLAHYLDLDRETQVEHLDLVGANQEKMKKWASHAPENFEHKYLLVEAEKSRLHGDFKPAIKLYDRAIALAGQNGFIQDEAIANERAANFFVSEGLEKIAGVYMQEARELYKRWGASLKVADLEREYSHLLPELPRDQVVPLAARPPLPATLLILDYASVVESLQTISSEIVLKGLLEKLIEIVIEIAGANRGVFISVKDGRLFVEAERKVENGQVATIRSIPVDERNDLSLAIVHYVQRTTKHVVLDDASQEGDFTSDPYIRRNHPKSLCCLPVIRQSRLQGILYLENSIATAAFTPDRVEMLQLLATQAAISLENATLVDDMKKAEEALRQSELRYRTLFESAPLGIGLSALEGRVLAYNDVMANMFGLSRTEMEQINVSVLYQNPDERELLLKQLRSDGFVGGFEAELKRKDSTSFQASLTITAFVWGGEDVLLTICEDITARKQAEEALRESEANFRAVAENANDGILIVTGKGQHLYANKRVTEISGYSVAELLNMDIRDLAHPDEIGKLTARLQKRLAGEYVPRQYETALVRKDGEIVPVEITGAQTVWQSQPTDLVVVRDITARKQAEEMLRESEEKYRHLVERASDGIGIGQDRVLKYVNPRYAEMVGYTVEEMTGTPLTDYIWPDEVATLFNRYERRIAGEDVLPRYETALLHRDGRKIEVELNAGIITYQGRPADFVFIQDITERKRTEQAILKQREKETQLRTISKEREELEEWINTFDTFVAKYDADGNMYFCNEAALRGTGVTKEDVYGQYFPDMVFWLHSDIERTKVAECFEKAKAGISSRIETSFMGVGGIPIPIIFNCQPVMDDEGYIKYITAEGKIIAEEVKLRTELEEINKTLEGLVAERTAELKALNEQLEELVKERTRELQEAQEQLLAAERLAVLGRFSGSVSHELRNPLGVIDSSVYYLKMKLEEPDPKVAQHLDRIQTHVQRATAIIESLRNLTQIHTPRKVRIDLASVIDRAVSTSQVPGSVELVRETPQEKWYVDADREQLHMAFENIIRNAVEAMEGQGKLTILARAVSPAGRPFAQISFADTGPGIEPDHLDKIFQPLFSTKVTGLGFGLAICQQIIERHGGTVEAQSEPGQGATFVVRLPLLPTT